jgi:hypothetical protein
MGNLRFSDGMEFDVTGDYRVERRSDGYYVLGGNMMFAVDTREEGIEEIRKLDPKAPIVLRYDEAKAKKPREFFEVGCKYKIIEEGGKIRWYRHMGGYQQGEGYDFSIGEIVTYEGYQYSGGSDGISCRAFSIKVDGTKHKGIFWPNNWGSVSEGFFQKVEA